MSDQGVCITRERYDEWVRDSAEQRERCESLRRRLEDAKTAVYIASLAQDQAVAREREACARLIEAWEWDPERHDPHEISLLVRAIRERGQG